MKVCFITSAINYTEMGGWGRYSAGIIKALAENYKVDIKILTSVDAKNDEDFNEYYRRVLPPGDKIFKNLLWLFFNYRKIKKEIFDCDFAHCLVEPYAPITYLLFRKKKFYITLHGTYGAQYLKNKKLKRLFKIIFKKARKNICVSEFTKNIIKSLANFKNLTVVHNGIDFKKFFRAERINRPDSDKFRILGVGALKYRKGYHLSIRAAALAAKSIPNLEYIIVGDQLDSHYYKILQNLVAELGLAGKVKFLQNISDQELIDLYYDSDLFVLTPVTERGEFEGYGLVYLEANACGLPVIGAIGSGAEEAIKNNYSGLLVEPKYEAVAKAIVKLYSDKELRNKISDTAVECARERDWSNVVKEYAHIYGLE